jgi:hypothetical protein
MIPGHETAMWNLYESSFDIDIRSDTHLLGDIIKNEMDPTPHISFVSLGVSGVDTSIAGLLGLAKNDRARLMYKSDLSPSMAEELAQQVLSITLPSRWSNITHSVKDFGAQVVVPTIVEAKDEFGAIGKWGTVALLALAVISLPFFVRELKS